MIDKKILELGKMFKVDQTKITQALSEANKFGGTTEGLRNLIQEKGGAGFIDKAFKAAKDPRVMIGLRFLGVSSEKVGAIENEIRGLLNGSNTNPSTPSNTNNQTSGRSSADDILERLKRFK